jgi:hypothetical protein
MKIEKDAKDAAQEAVAQGFWEHNDSIDGAEPWAADVEDVPREYMAEWIAAWKAELEKLRG